MTLEPTNTTKFNLVSSFNLCTNDDKYISKLTQRINKVDEDNLKTYIEKLEIKLSNILIIKEFYYRRGILNPIIIFTKKNLGILMNNQIVLINILIDLLKSTNSQDYKNQITNELFDLMNIIYLIQDSFIGFFSNEYFLECLEFIDTLLIYGETQSCPIAMAKIRLYYLIAEEALRSKNIIKSLHYISIVRSRLNCVLEMSNPYILHQEVELFQNASLSLYNEIKENFPNDFSKYLREK